ncbi:hypothetical protein GDO86_018438 [Hymenochirus boettgeri]|uniref:Uncharacterized protein n=1 Tax=Hymenochirus boettgeri TaxID=247094 RepID=A0A8T2IDP0_9PIPI|nr:hypothetical protein GDO86_018438 [Hymenochirus boettgeri]KAG8430123.1 hypothetical protein GDO86_018438 [Hymenochirus boettgeri]
MKRSLACNVGATKGTTRVAQEVWVDSEIKMVDSPALVVSPHNPPITVTMRSSCEGEEDDVLGAVDVILRHASKQQMMMNYTLPGYTTSLEFLTLLANKRGMLKKGGVADTNKAARLLLGDWAG